MTLEPQWSQLLHNSQTDQVFLTHTWFRCWWEAFGDDGTLHIICLRDGKELVGIAPLCLKRSWFRGLPVRKLAFLANAYSAHAGVIIAQPEEQMIEALFDYLYRCKSQWDMLELDRLGEDSPIWTILRSKEKSRALNYTTRADIRSPYIPIEGSWQTYLSQRSRSQRKAIKRRLSRIRKHTKPVKVVRLSSPEELNAALEEVMTISARSWKAYYGRAISNNLTARTFFQKMSTLLGAKGWVNLWIVYCGEKPVAFEYHLHYGGVTSPIRADFDERYRSISPGAYLELEILRSLFEDPRREIHEYNTCADEYSHELKWTDSIRPYTRAWVFPSNGYGRVLSLLSKVRRLRSNNAKGKDNTYRARALCKGYGKQRAAAPSDVIAKSMDSIRKE